MAVSPEERFHQRQPRYSKEEFARRGDEIYESQVRAQVEAGNHGKIVAIDIETGVFEVADEILTATNRLFERLPDAQPWIVRIGHRVVHRFGARSLRQSV
jgi:outer membrane protein assembly factor BamB